MPTLVTALTKFAGLVVWGFDSVSIFCHFFPEIGTGLFRKYGNMNFWTYGLQVQIIPSGYHFYIFL